MSEQQSGTRYQVAIEVIKERVSQGKYVISYTHTEKMRQRKIEAQDIEKAISRGRIIEDYPDDPKGHSCLILGYTSKGRALHVLCGKLEAEEILIITGYEPSPEEWESDWKTRKER